MYETPGTQINFGSFLQVLHRYVYRLSTCFYVLSRTMGVRKRLSPEEEIVWQEAAKERKRQREEKMNKHFDAYAERMKEMHKTLVERKRMEENDKAEAEAQASGLPTQNQLQSMPRARPQYGK